MADSLQVRLEGIDELKRALADAAAEIRTKAVRGALRQAGNVIRKSARQAVPVLARPVMRGGQLARKPQTVRNAIAVRNSKLARREGNEGVFVGVRPAKGARFRTRTVKALGVRIRQRTQVRASKRGRYSPDDPYYWRYLEFGTRHMGARAFLRPAFEAQGRAAIDAFMESVVPQINKINARAARVR